MQEISVEEMLELLKKHTYSNHKQLINIENSLGRAVAEDVIAPYDSPSVDISSVTGYALRLEDVQQLPVGLVQVATSSRRTHYKEALGNGETVLTFRGSPVPEGADLIIPVEKVKAIGDSVRHLGDSIKKDGANILIGEDLAPIISAGVNITYTGVDYSKDSVIVPKGSIINSRTIGFLASLRLPWVTVGRSPRIGLLAVGNELKPIGDIGSRDAVIPSSVYSMCNEIDAYGGSAINLGIVDNESESIKEACLSSIAGLDMLITTGCTSESSEDYLFNILNDMSDDGIKSLRVPIGTGETVMYGTVKGVLVCCFPGNCTATMIATSLIMRPLIHHMLGVNTRQDLVRYAVLGRNLDEYDMQYNYLCANIEFGDDGRILVNPTSGVDSQALMMTKLPTSDCMIVIDPKNENTKGSLIPIMMLGSGHRG